MSSSTEKLMTFNCQNISTNTEDVNNINSMIQALDKINQKLEDLPKIITEIEQMKKTTLCVENDIKKHDSAIISTYTNLKCVNKEMNNLQQAVRKTNTKFEYLERQKCNLNILISNIPVSNDKTDLEIIENVANVLGIDVKNQISNVKRIINKSNSKVSPKILCSCSNIEIKNSIMSNYAKLTIKKIYITLKQIGLSSTEFNENIYISEQLTQYNNDIYYIARQARKIDPEYFLSVFTHNGLVCVKISANNATKYIKINSIDKLYNICSESTREKLYTYQHYQTDDENILKILQ